MPRKPKPDDPEQSKRFIEHGARSRCRWFKRTPAVPSGTLVKSGI